MNATPRRIITVTSSFCFNKISTDYLGNRVVVRGEALLCPPEPFSTAGLFSGQSIKDDVNGFPGYLLHGF
jgi:hypothetical protein